MRYTRQVQRQEIKSKGTVLYFLEKNHNKYYIIITNLSEFHISPVKMLGTHECEKKICDSLMNVNMKL